jgi:hypothetical protein
VDIVVEVFRGFGGQSSGIVRNVLRAVEELRSEGFNITIVEIVVPALDDEFEAFVRVNGVEIYVPSIPVDEKLLADYLLWRAVEASGVGIAGFPLPPALFEGPA